MTHTPAAVADPVDPWSRLEAGCAAVLDLSRDLEAHIEAGVDVSELVPLLEREHDAVTGLRGQIAALTASSSSCAVDAARRDGVAARLQELLAVGGRSRELLARRGVRLKPPRWRRGATRKGS